MAPTTAIFRPIESSFASPAWSARLPDLSIGAGCSPSDPGRDFSGRRWDQRVFFVVFLEDATGQAAKAVASITGMNPKGVISCVSKRSASRVEDAECQRRQSRKPRRRTGHGQVDGSISEIALHVIRFHTYARFGAQASNNKDKLERRLVGYRAGAVARSNAATASGASARNPSATRAPGLSSNSSGRG